MTSIHEVYHHIIEQFEIASIPDPHVDAAILFRYVLGLSRSDLVLKSNEPIGSKEKKILSDLARKRLNRVPLAYLTGEQDFFGRTFTVNPSVLIPRPETELLVEKAIICRKDFIDSGDSLTIIDLGTGSGVIAVTLAKEIQAAKIYAVDRSLNALQVARENAVSHNVSNCIDFIASDWVSAIKPNIHFDVIISNPPYVAENIKENLQAELLFEPAEALFSGNDGTIALQNIIKTASRHLAPGGILLTEIGYDQKEFVLDYADNVGLFSDVCVHNDYSGLPRILQARLKGK